jgi:exopolysaccharide biosynthesis polyprenyl glycosylphosphotransferase
MKSILRENKDFSLQLFLVISDVALIIISFMAAYYLRHKVPGIPGPGFLAYHNSIPIVTILWIGIFAYFGLYKVRRAWRHSEVVFNTTLAITLGMALYLAVSYMLKEFFFSRLLLIFLWIVNIILISSSRTVFKLILLKLRKLGYGIQRILIVGNTASSKMLTKAIDLHPELGYRIVGYLTPEGIEGTKENDVDISYSSVGGTSTIVEECKKLKPDEAVFTIPIGKREELWALINSLQKEGVEIKIVPDIYDFLPSRMVMDDLEGIPTIRFRPIMLQIWEKIFKLILDYMGSIILLIFLSPLLIYVYLRLKLSPGKGILTKETVIGLFGRPFKIYRFIIPVDLVHSNPTEKSAPTPFGQFLYRYSLCDLPQLLNILKGEMSLVGPRPESPSRVERYSEWHRRRLLIKPGITGLAQVNGLRGFASSDEKTRFDLKYIEEHSVFLDIKILLQTIWVLLKRHKQPIALTFYK